MTLRLILTRHAKSSWGDADLADHDRPLNKRGRASADAVGAWLDGNGYRPGEVLVSSSRRTRETWARMADALEQTPEARVLRKLYLAEPDEMLAVLREARGDCVLMIGHNPGTAFMAQALVGVAPADSRFRHYPTAATTIIDFDAPEWREVNWHQGKLVDFTVPRDL